MSRPPRKVDPSVYPCDTCRKKGCASTGCPQWWPNFLERWSMINAYAIANGVELIH